MDKTNFSSYTEYNVLLKREKKIKQSNFQMLTQVVEIVGYRIGPLEQQCAFTVRSRTPDIDFQEVH